MQILVSAMQKGGQGKTFLTCHLAYYFYEKGLRVAVIDLDVQGNASFTLSAYASSCSASCFFQDNEDNLFEKNLPPPNEEKGSLTLFSADAALAELESKDLSTASKCLQKTIHQLKPFYDVCFIDTKPSLGVSMVSALLVSDFILCPIELEAYSLHGMQKMVTVLSHIREKNPTMQFLGMLPNKVDTRKPRHTENLHLLRQNFPSLVLPFVIGARDSIAEALGEKKPVWNIKKTAARKAAQEVRILCAHVWEAMFKKQ